ncbi:c-type cytochrome [Halalkalibacter urbisdiaboli]|uniref:c-type cytochrome n=1 Tax=Halalkalibacter urbisdiaboli TaxID=1960589 RepID=UPI000B42DD46|nr:c-type cytochrome [Halalkalibacter urbisdiaboli]
MKKFLLTIGAVFALTACGGGNEPAPEEAPVEEAPAEETGGEEAAGDVDATAARATYEKSCIGCHGGNLEGGAGPALAGGELSADEIQTVIHKGQGAMPPQTNVSEEEAANLAKWLEIQ